METFISAKYNQSRFKNIMTTKINLIIKEAPKKNWFSCVQYFKQKSSENDFNKRDIHFIVKKLKEKIENKKINQSINWMMLGIIFSPDAFLDKIKKEGVLRPSRYNFDTSLLTKMIDKISINLHLTRAMADYLLSIKNLYLLSSEVNKMKLDIIRELRIGKETALRCLIQNLDYIFMLEAMNKRPLAKKHNDRKNIADKIQFFSSEELAEAMGYIFHIYSESVRYPQGFDNVSRDISTINLEKILINAAKIRFFLENEVILDSYKYNLDHPSEDGNNLTLQSLDENFSKSVSLGYIHSKSQELARLNVPTPTESLSLEDAAKSLANTFGKNLMTLKEKPIKRYVFEFPWGAPITDFFSSSAFFSEEAAILDFYANEWSIPIHDLLNFEVRNDLKIWDVLKIHRIITFFRWVIIGSLETFINDQKEIVLNSLSPIFRKEQLKEIFDLVLGKNSDTAIDFLSYNFGQDGVFDLQYQPILSIRNGYVIPFNILANSSILRNSIQLSRKRFFEDGTIDPLTDLIHDTFRKKTKTVKKNLKYQWKGKHGEIDVISIIDNILFVIECKNSTLPCNLFEMRTSHDYILKASSQLKCFKEKYNDLEFKKMLSQKLNYDIDKQPLVTGIIMSNRMFSGYRIDNNSVRGSLEFVNFIETGSISIGSEEKCFWEKSYFTENDLYNYLEKDITFIPLWNALISINSIYPIGAYNLQKTDYALDIKVLAENLGFQEIVKIIDAKKKRSC